MYIVTVTFTLKPAHVADFHEAIVANARLTREREPGCRQFDVCTAPTDEASVFLYEVYDDKAAFDAHLATPHFLDFNAATAPWVERKAIHFYTRIHPVGAFAAR